MSEPAMAAAPLSKVQFFAPEQVIANLNDWELQSGANPTISRQRAQSLKKNGDELHTVQYGAQIAYNENFTASKYTGNLEVPNAGAVSNGAHIDTVTVSYTQTAAPTLAVTSHKHATVAGAAQDHDACRVYEPSVQLPARAIGIPSTIKFKKGAAGTLTDVFTLPSGIGMRSMTYALSVTHTDIPDGDGDHLAGQNRDGVETLTLEFTGKVVVSELAIDSDWMLPDSDADGQGNTQETTKSITISRHLAYSTTATPSGGEK